MNLIPSSFGKFFSRFQSRTSHLPTYNQSQTTLFDDLPEDEKKAALAKLHDLAAKQPGQDQSKHQSPVRRRRLFNW